MTVSLRLALVSGPQYDALYDRLPDIERTLGISISVAFRGSHPELNEELASYDSQLPYDLVSTHIKYAPSQAHLLRPLDALLDATDLEQFMPELLNHARFEGALLQLPRNFDARLLHYRTDLMPEPPETWVELVDTCRELRRSSKFGFMYPGWGSGLFGTFFELLVMNGGRLFDEALQPAFNSEIAHGTLEQLRDMYAIAPWDLEATYFDEVSGAFRDGQVVAIGDWPGYFDLHRKSTVSDRTGLARYPKGSAGVVRVYSGSHSFAITRNCSELPAALALLQELTGFESQLAEARRGVFPTRVDVLDQIRTERLHDAVALTQLDALAEIIAAGEALTFPPLKTYPDIEEAAWPLLQQAIAGTISSRAALDQIDSLCASVQ